MNINKELQEIINSKCKNRLHIFRILDFETEDFECIYCGYITNKKLAAEYHAWRRAERN